MVDGVCICDDIVTLYQDNPAPGAFMLHVVYGLYVHCGCGHGEISHGVCCYDGCGNGVFRSWFMFSWFMLSWCM